MKNPILPLCPLCGEAMTKLLPQPVDGGTVVGYTCPKCGLTGKWSTRSVKYFQNAYRQAIRWLRADVATRYCVCVQCGGYVPIRETTSVLIGARLCDRNQPAPHGRICDKCRSDWW